MVREVAFRVQVFGENNGNHDEHQHEEDTSGDDTLRFRAERQSHVPLHVRPLSENLTFSSLSSFACSNRIPRVEP